MEKLEKLRRVITVEPIIVTYETAYVFRLFLHSTTRSHFQDEELEGYQLTNNVFDRLVIPAIVLLFLSANSDKHHRRKPLFLLPVFGECVSILGYLFCMTFSQKCPLKMSVFFQIVPACFGGHLTFMVFILSYIVDVTVLKNRAFRIGIVYILFYVSAEIQRFCFGNFYWRGNEWTWSVLSLILVSFSFFYGLFWVKEPQRFCPLPLRSFFIDALNPKHIQTTLSMLFSKNTVKNRTYMYLILWVLFFYNSIRLGEDFVYYKFTKSVDIISLIGIALMVFVFTVIVQIDHLVVLSMCCIVKILSIVVLAITKNLTAIYAAFCLNSASSFIPVVLKTMITKVTSGDHIAKTMTLIQVVEMLSVELTIAFSNIHVEYFSANQPIFAYFFKTFMYVSFILIIVWMYVRNKRERVLEYCSVGENDHENEENSITDNTNVQQATSKN